MKRNLTLQIGLGRTGNVLVDCLKNYNKLYNNILFVNSSLADVSALPSYNSTNTFIFGGTDGSGRNKDRATIFVKDNINSLADSILKYSNVEHIFLWFSLDGGTGSTTSVYVAKLLKKLSPNKIIHAIGVMPSVDKVDKVGLRNCIETWNEIMDLYDKGIIQTFRCIDNSTRNTYSEINMEAIKTFDESFNLIGRSDNDGTIDTADQERILSARGYILTLPLNDKFNNTKSNVENSMKNSVYLIPNTMLNCDYLGINTSSNEISTIRNMFEVYESTYNTSNNKGEGRIVLSGCDIPTDGISIIKMALEEKENKMKNRTRSEIVKVEISKNDETEVSTKSTEPIIYSSQELDDLLSDLF